MTDLWSSVSLKPYLSFIVHFIDEEWKLRNRCLQTSFLPEDHTGDNIANALEGVHSSWNLHHSRQVCLTTDNGSNIVSAARKLEW